MDTRLFYAPATGKRYNNQMLRRYGLTPESPEIMPLLYAAPPHNPDLQRAADTGNVSGPDASGNYAVVYELHDLNLETAKARLKARIAVNRYEAEMGGVDFDADSETIRLATDAESRTRLQTAIDAAPEEDTDPGTINYKLGGSFRSMTRVELLALRDAIAAHVQACFDRERALYTAIDAAQSVAELEKIHWAGETPEE